MIVLESHGKATNFPTQTSDRNRSFRSEMPRSKIPFDSEGAQNWPKILKSHQLKVIYRMCLFTFKLEKNLCKNKFYSSRKLIKWCDFNRSALKQSLDFCYPWYFRIRWCLCCLFVFFVVIVWSILGGVDGCQLLGGGVVVSFSVDRSSFIARENDILLSVCGFDVVVVFGVVFVVVVMVEVNLDGIDGDPENIGAAFILLFSSFSNEGFEGGATSDLKGIWLMNLLVSSYFSRFAYRDEFLENSRNP